MPEFYTQNGWKGEKYEETRNLSTTDIAKLIRKDIKEKHPDIKASVRTSYFSGGSSIDVRIKEIDFNPINIESLLWDARKYNEAGQEILDSIKSICDKYRYSDCNGMIDYFNVNFWCNVDYDWEIIRIYEECRRAESDDIRDGPI